MLSASAIKYDYADSYEGYFVDRNDDITAAQIGKAFFSSAPNWVSTLFAIRNKIVRFFGLKVADTAADKQALLDKFTCSPNERLGLFKVFERTTNEVIVGEDDKHLNFRVSLLKAATDDANRKKITVSTTVVFKNAFGKIYFLPVKPFHRIIVPAMLKRIITTLEKQQ
jgi:hypothetical protein